MIELSVMILAIAGAVIAIVAVPTLLEVRRTARQAQDVLTLVRNEVIPVAREIGQAAAQVQEITANIEAGLGQIRQFAGNVEAAGRSFLTFPEGIRRSFGHIMWKSIVLGAGVRAAVSGLRWWTHRTSKQQEVRNGH